MSENNNSGMVTISQHVAVAPRVHQETETEIAQIGYQLCQNSFQN